MPLYASSVKWFPMPFMGVQLLASGAIQGSGQEGFLGGRVYLSPPQKIFQDDLLTGGVFAGAGVYQLEGDIAAGIKHSYVEAGISVEMKLDDIANTLFKTKYLFVHSGSSTEDFFWDVVVLGIMNAAYLGIDVAIQKEYNGPIETFFGMGFHIYF